MTFRQLARWIEVRIALLLCLLGKGGEWFLRKRLIRYEPAKRWTMADLQEELRIYKRQTPWYELW